MNVPRFRHVEPGRTVVFGHGALEQAADLLPDAFVLLSTRRAAADAPGLADRAAEVVEVPGGAVDELAARLRDQVGGRPVVALGGGRVIDTAKAIAAAERVGTVVAIPTSPSGAEMTGVHRHARGVPGDTPRVRPSVVVNDPALSASLPERRLAAGSANATAHAMSALFSVRASPIVRAVAQDAIARMTRAWTHDGDIDRAGVALAALLAAWSVDLSGLGPHHAIAQTVVRIAGVEHAHANAALLPFTTRAAIDRAPHAMTSDAREALLRLAEDLRVRAQAIGLGAVGTDTSVLDEVVETAVSRPELDRVPPAMDAAELRALLASAAG